MSNSQMSTSGQSLPIRVVAGVVLSLSMIIAGLYVLVAIAPTVQPDHSETAPQTAPVSTASLIIPPLLALFAGVGISGILEGVARLLDRPAGGGSGGVTAAAPAVNVEKLTAVVSQMHANLPVHFDGLRQYLQQTPSTVGNGQTDPAAESTTDVYLERMVKLLEEMKELSMLDDAQRQQRRKLGTDRRKTTRLEEAGRLIQQREWGQADSLLHLLDSLHPGDPEVQARRGELQDARTLTQTVEFDSLGAKVEDLMALSNYDQAVAETTNFLDQFPGHPDCEQLLQRVQRERSIYIDRNANGLYEQIKAAVEARQWRVALDGIQQFLQNFPDHPRAEKIRQQVRPIQKNAEIEERHDLENRIRELVNARQYGEAADLAEDLLQRFPESNQAAHLAEILPKLRERASAEVSGNVFLG